LARQVEKRHRLTGGPEKTHFDPGDGVDGAARHQARQHGCCHKPITSEPVEGEVDHKPSEKRLKASRKKHLAGLGLTLAQYREKWKLPADYPMVAPSSRQIK
jgi:hypothetical protein